MATDEDSTYLAFAAPFDSGRSFVTWSTEAHSYDDDNYSYAGQVDADTGLGEGNGVLIYLEHYNCFIYSGSFSAGLMDGTMHYIEGEHYSIDTECFDNGPRECV